MKTLSMSFFYIYHKLTQGIWDDRFFAPFTTTLPVRCLMQLHTLVEKTLKPFFQTAPFNISEHFMLKVGLFFQYDVRMYVCIPATSRNTHFRVLLRPLIKEYIPNFDRFCLRLLNWTVLDQNTIDSG